MPKTIVSDTSCLIILDKIGRLNLLQQLFGRITVTNYIALEFANPLPDFFDIEDPTDFNSQKILNSYLDAGEASAIALALEKADCLLIIDEFRGRREAKLLNIHFTGTIGLFILAKEKGLIESINTIFDEIKITNFRLSERLIIEAKLRCDE
jgi:predicted nucleic acid-binding protein